MELTITNIVTVALFIEALVQAIKPLWNKAANKLSLPECISMAVGVLVAILGKINMLDGLFTVGSPALVYVLYAMSGVALGRGPSFVHDLWTKVKTFNVDTAAQAAENAVTLKEILLTIIGQGK